MAEKTPKLPKRAVKDLLKRPPDDETAWQTMLKLKTFGGQTVAIMGGAFLDNVLQRLLKTAFISLDKEADERLFDGSRNGILGTFSNKTRIAYAMGLIDFDTYNDLTIINDIRNAFAHSQHQLDFKHPDVLADCDKLLVIRKEQKQMDGKNALYQPIDLTDRLELFYQTIFRIRMRLWAQIYLTKKHAGSASDT